MIVTEEGKEKKVNIDFEPFKPINTSLYLCDNKFHTEALTALLADDNRFGFIVMDGNGALFGTLQGNTRNVLQKFTVDLPKKHGRGGQSVLRFARLRMEKRHNYVRKVAEVAVTLFIQNDKPSISGLILAGSADFKTELSQSDMFDPRLQAKIIKLVDVSYGGENGFNQAIELAAESLVNVKFIQEKKLIGKYFNEISQDTGKYCFGVEDTLKALEMGAVETLICWENLDIQRVALMNHTSGEEKILFLNSEQAMRERDYMKQLDNKFKNFLAQKNAQTPEEAQESSAGPSLVDEDLQSAKKTGESGANSNVLGYFQRADKQEDGGRYHSSVYARHSLHEQVGSSQKVIDLLVPCKHRFQKPSAAFFCSK